MTPASCSSAGGASGRIRRMKLVTYREAALSGKRVRYWVDGYGILPAYPTVWHTLPGFSAAAEPYYGDRECFELEQ